MIIAIAAATIAAAQPAAAPASPPAQHESMMQMGDQQHGQMADMKSCCCHDMMAKMRKEHPGTHEGRSGV